MNSSLTSNRRTVDAVGIAEKETLSVELPTGGAAEGVDQLSSAAKGQMPPDALDIKQINKALVLVPHPDDESIGCGGLLALLAEQNASVHLILVSDGSGAGGLPEGAAQQRQQEFDQAVRQLGHRLTWECWQFLDGRLSQEKGLQQKIQNSVVHHKPCVLIAPWLQDMHPDHAATGKAALLAYRELIKQKSRWLRGILFYEVWTPLPATHILNISTVWQKKTAALQQHKTALACGNYLRATEALASYRSLLSGSLAAEGEYAEAYYYLQSELLAYPVKKALTEVSSSSNKYQVRYADRQDAVALRRLFISVFGDTPEEDWWQKKYGQEPIAGTLAVDQNNNVIAFYGALSRQARWQGKALKVAQQADVMVAAPYRFATRNEGVFASVSRRFLEEQLGPDRNYQMAYGFPTARALKLGVHLGLYQEGDDLAYWEHSSPPSPMGLGWQVGIKSCRKEKQWQWVNQLKPFMAEADNLFWLEKTGHYWAHRYRLHPQKDYRILRLYRWGRLRGVAIIQLRYRATVIHCVEIMDLALQGDHPDSAQKLMAAIINYSDKQGAEHTTAWGTRTAIDELQRYAQNLHHPGESKVVEQGRMALPGDIFNTPVASEVRSRCWMLGGDTDFR